MKRLALAVFLLIFSHPAAAFTIATGPSEGTYFQVAQDIKYLAAKDGVELNVLPTQGSFENIKLLGGGKVDLAIVQLDAFRFVADVLREQQGLNVFDKIKVVLNLYPEEIHVVSNQKDVQSFYHLEGKRVSVGQQGGGSALTAAVLFNVYDIKSTVFFEAFDDSIKKMEQGNLDAVIFVGGGPVPFITKLDDRFHFVRLPASPVLEEIYLRTQLGKDHYPWAKANTETYAVPSVIMGLDNRDEPYAGQMQQLVLAVLNGFSYLDTNGHPKWKSSIIRTYFPYRGYEPTNQVIQSYNIIDNRGYRIVKK